MRHAGLTPSVKGSVLSKDLCTILMHREHVVDDSQSQPDTVLARYDNMCWESVSGSTKQSLSGIPVQVLHASYSPVILVILPNMILPNMILSNMILYNKNTWANTFLAK